MSGLPANDGSNDGDGPIERARKQGLWWWLRAVEVRLRFVLLTGLALLVATQWGRLQAWSGTLLHRFRGETTEHAVSADTEFFCPMDPTVVTAWPAICPICNMDLVPRKKSEAQLLPEGVVARMQLTPYRIQLAGIRTSEVVPMELEHQIEVFGVLRAAGDEQLAFDATISRADEAQFAVPREAMVTAVDGPGEPVNAIAALVPQDASASAAEPPKVRVTLAQGESGLIASMGVRAVIHVPVVETTDPDDAATSNNERQADVLAIPESAVVDHGYQQLVFVESMDGMFDAVVVELGRRCGDYYPVESGLTAGERVVVNGAFLIDAETRLNPSLAVQYFGANQVSATGRVPQLRVAGAPTELSPEDQLLAEAQALCPVTGKPLDSMGGPVLVLVEGRKVFICCRGCEGALTREPDKYLERLPSDD
jgi:Cu(I)/Ag(I) efflux system membrane fusion protein